MEKNQESPDAKRERVESFKSEVRALKERFGLDDEDYRIALRGLSTLEEIAFTRRQAK